MTQCEGFHVMAGTQLSSAYSISPQAPTSRHGAGLDAETGASYHTQSKANKQSEHAFTVY